MVFPPRSICLAAATLSLGLLTAGRAAVACDPAHHFPTMEPGVLTVAESTYAPYSTLNPDGTIGGVDGDVVTKIAAMECLAVKVSAVASAAAIPSVTTGRADVTTGDWYRTAARAQVAGLSAPIYADQTAIYSKTGIATVQDLVGKQVGTVQGFLYVEDLRKLVGSGLHLYPNAVNLEQDVAAGRIDAAVDSYSTGVIAQQNGKLPGVQLRSPPPDPRTPSLQPGQACFPYDKSNTALGAALDADIATLRANGSIAEILKAHGLDPSAADPGPPKLL